MQEHDYSLPDIISQLSQGIKVVPSHLLSLTPVFLYSTAIVRKRLSSSVLIPNLFFFWKHYLFPHPEPIKENNWMITGFGLY